MFRIWRENVVMKDATSFRVVEVERLAGGVLIAFNTGEAAHYSAELLHSMIAQADRLPAKPGRLTRGAETQSQPGRRATRLHVVRN